MPLNAYALANLSIGGAFTVWASLFIYRSSLVGIDGKRYFCLFDDAMISMRYSWNLSHGFGLVWNPGEYVEGYTNLLMTLLMSLTSLVFDKGAAVLSVQLLGIVFLLVNAFLLMSVAEHLMLGQERYRRLFQVLAFLCALSYYPLVYWSLMGMETGLLAVLLSLSVLSALKYGRDFKPAQGLLLSVSLGLAFLTRPDALVFAIPLFAYVFYAARKSERSSSFSFLFILVGLYVLFILGQELFRLGYYGEWLPNTYILKVSGMPFLARVWNGIFFVAPFLKEVYLLLIVVGGGIVFGFHRNKLFLASLFVVLVCYQVWAGGDPWNYWRILSPSIPLMLILGVHEILIALEAVSDTEGFRRYFLRNPILPRQLLPGLLACLLVLAMLWSVNHRFLPEIALLEKPFDTDRNVQRVNDAILVREWTTPEATVGVYGAGTIPYYSERYGIDFLGKTDPYIARLAPELGEVGGSEGVYMPGHNKSDLEYSIKELRPTFVEDGLEGIAETAPYNQNLLEWGESELAKVDYKGMSVYFLKESKNVHWDDIRASLEKEVEDTEPASG